MKVVTSAALLRRTPDATQRTCRFIGSPYYLAKNLLDPPSRGRTVTFVDALAMSNNQCFAQTRGARTRQRRRDRPDAELRPARVAGARVTSRARSTPVHDRLELGKLGSGLAGSRISPLAAARMAAALVDGQLVTPRWIARVRDANGDELRFPSLPAPRLRSRAGAHRTSCAR